MKKLTSPFNLEYAQRKAPLKQDNSVNQWGDWDTLLSFSTRKLGGGPQKRRYIFRNSKTNKSVDISRPQFLKACESFFYQNASFEKGEMVS
jgi:hypothetical protein